MNLEIEEQRIRDLLAEIENESEDESQNLELPPLREDDGSDDSDVDEQFIRNEGNNQLISDTEESEVSEDEGNADLNVEGPFYVGKNGTTRWSYTPVKANTQTRAHNIVTKLPGPVRAAKNAKSALECFSLFFPDDFIEKIVTCTNSKIRSVQAEYSRARDARETDFSEISAYIGILYLLGVCKSNKANTLDVWRNDGLGIEIFRLIMGVNRFKFLQQNVRFDDISDVNRAQRKEMDKLYCVRDLFEEFVKNCKTNYSHSPFVTVDEMLPNFRGRCSFRVFMPQKPGKYGLKIWACSDARTYYTSHLEIFVGNQNPGPYRLNNSIPAIVHRSVSHLENSGRNITCDNLFTSVPLAESLLQRKLTIVGTMRKNKAEIPPLFVAKNKDRPVPSSMFGFSTTSTLVSYKPKPGKVVVLLSTLHENDAIDAESGDHHKPEIVTFYNKTKIGVDTSDALQKKYSVSRICTRWPLSIFYFMLNVGGINSFVIFRHNAQADVERRKCTRKDFLYSLGKSLTKDHCRRRLYESNIPSSMKERICEIFSLPRKRPLEAPEEARNTLEVRCHYCPAKKNRKTKQKCNTCLKPICREHTVTVCMNCHGNVQEGEESE